MKLIGLAAIGIGGYYVAKQYGLIGGDGNSSKAQVAKSDIMRKQVQPFSIIPYLTAKKEGTKGVPLLNNNAATCPDAPSTASPSSIPHSYTPPVGSTPENRSDTP